MDIRHLRYAVVVAEERSFTRAAERLYLSQPGLSRAIRELEAKIGIEIFDRSGRQLELTSLGDRVVAHARMAVDTFDAAMLAIDSLSGRSQGTI